MNDRAKLRALKRAQIVLGFVCAVLAGLWLGLLITDPSWKALVFALWMAALTALNLTLGGMKP